MLLDFIHIAIVIVQTAVIVVKNCFSANFLPVKECVRLSLGKLFNLAVSREKERERERERERAGKVEAML